MVTEPFTTNERKKKRKEKGEEGKRREKVEIMQLKKLLRKCPATLSGVHRHR